MVRDVLIRKQVEMTKAIEDKFNCETEIKTHRREIHATEFELEGFCCVRFFDPNNGKLCVSGPAGSRPARRRYVRKYSGLCRNEELRDFLAKIRPPTGMNVKLHAVLHLMERYEHEEIGEGVIIRPDALIEVLDSLAPWTPIDPEACH
jgi:hypothetical protein